MYPTAAVLICFKNERTMDAQATATRQRSKHKENARHARQPVRRPSIAKSDHDIRFEDPDVENGSIWHDAPLFAAILPCVGALFLWDGADYVTDTILFLCVTWYLHMLIKGTYLIPAPPFALIILRSILMSSHIFPSSLGFVHPLTTKTTFEPRGCIDNRAESGRRGAAMAVNLLPDHCSRHALLRLASAAHCPCNSRCCSAIRVLHHVFPIDTICPHCWCPSV